MSGPNRRGRMSPLALLSLTAVVLACVYLAVQSRVPEESRAMGVHHPAVGRSLDVLALEPLTGEGASVTLQDFAGRPLLINFWGEWCGPCRIEFPHLVELKEVLDQAGVAFLSVSCGPGADPENPEALQYRTQQFLSQRNVRGYPTHWDPDFRTRLHFIRAADLPDFAYPTTVLIDAEGVIRGLWMGYWRGAEKEIESAALAVADA